jgi:hypothetical protein
MITVNFHISFLLLDGTLDNMLTEVITNQLNKNTYIIGLIRKLMLIRWIRWKLARNAAIFTFQIVTRDSFIFSSIVFFFLLDAGCWMLLLLHSECDARIEQK